MTCLTSPLSRQIDQMLHDWCSFKEITLTLRCHEKQVRARANRTGYRKHLITQEEQGILASLRKIKKP